MTERTSAASLLGLASLIALAFALAGSGKVADRDAPAVSAQQIESAPKVGSARAIPISRSDAATLQKLRDDQLVALAQVNYWSQELVNPYPMDRTEQQTTAILDSVATYQRKLDLATLALHRFMDADDESAAWKLARSKSPGRF